MRNATPSQDVIDRIERECEILERQVDYRVNKRRMKEIEEAERRLKPVIQFYHRWIAPVKYKINF